MRFLIDNALPPRLALLLRQSGHDAVHVRDYRIQGAPDEVILARALDEDRILVSADSDFGAILARQGGNRPSFILFREPRLVTAEDYLFRILASEAALEEDLTKGCVAVFRAGRIRIRSLPISDS